MPWSFLIDVLIACLPMMFANQVHGLWAAILVYLIVLASLRGADHWALQRKWGVFGRAIPKIAIFVIAEGLISLSGFERCGPDLGNCRRVFF
jgi:hypothetical protein